MTDLNGKRMNELTPLRNAISRLAEESLLYPRALISFLGGVGTIPMDVYEEGENLVVKASVPGVKPADLNIEVRDNVLTISGETKGATEKKEKGYLLNEHSYGQIQRSVILPVDVVVAKADAEFEDGMLTLTLPKAQASKGKKILLKSKPKTGKKASAKKGSTETNL